MRRNRIPTASALGLVAGLMLTGCAGGQSAAEACTIVQTTMVQAQEDLSESVTSFGNDPVAGAAAVDELSAAFSKANDTITSSDVKPATDKAEEALEAFAGEMGKAAADQANVDSDALTGAIGEIQTAFADVQEACTA